MTVRLTTPEDGMSDAPAWVAVVVSVVALAYTFWVDQRLRREARKAAADKRQADIDDAISRVVAQWGVTNLKDVNWHIDSNLQELKDSALRWRQGVAEPLAKVPDTSRAHELISKTVKAVSDFERVIDPMREEKVERNWFAVQDAMSDMQNTVWGSINTLTALKRSAPEK